MKKVAYTPIGIIHTSLKKTGGKSVHRGSPEGIKGTIEIFPAYSEGLSDLEGFSHIIVLFHMHLSKGYNLKIKTHFDDNLRGLFSCHSPNRPNPIGLSIVRLEKIESSALYITDVDMFGGTPLLDIKSYVPEDRLKHDIRIGWLTGKIKS